MRSVLGFSILLLACAIGGCSKEEGAQSTRFEGLVRLGSIEVSFSDVQLEVYGMAYDSRCFIFCSGITKYNKVFPLGPDGSFSIPVSTEEVEYFRLGIRINGERVISECAPLSLCTDLNPGRDYNGLLLTFIE